MVITISFYVLFANYILINIYHIKTNLTIFLQEDRLDHNKKNQKNSLLDFQQKKNIKNYNHIIMNNQFFNNSIQQQQPNSKLLFKSVFYLDPQYTIPVQATYFAQKILFINLSFNIQLKFNSKLKFQLLKIKSQNSNQKDVQSNKLVGIKFQLQEKIFYEFYTNNQEDLLRWRLNLSKVIHQLGFYEIYKPLRKIAKGSNSTVYYGKRIEDQCEYAIKAFSKQYLLSESKGLDILENQIKIMRQLDHKNIIKLQQVLQTENSIYLIVQYLKGGHLYSIFDIKLTYSILKTIIVQLLQAILYLAQKKILHRDIKPQNILFRKLDTFELVIADFGLSTKINDPNQIFLRCGTPGFMAPQVLRSTYQDSQNIVSDMFSIGALLHLLIFKEYLFQGKQYSQILEKNKQCKINFNQQRYKQIDPKLLNLITLMLQVDPKLRITPQAALNHQFLKSTQIDNNQISVLQKLDDQKEQVKTNRSKKLKYRRLEDSFGVLMIAKENFLKHSRQSHELKEQQGAILSPFTPVVNQNNPNKLKQSRFTMLENQKSAYFKIHSSQTKKKTYHQNFKKITYDDLHSD